MLLWFLGERRKRRAVLKACGRLPEQDAIEIQIDSARFYIRQGLERALTTPRALTSLACDSEPRPGEEKCPSRRHEEATVTGNRPIKELVCYSSYSAVRGSYRSLGECAGRMFSRNRLSIKGSDNTVLRIKSGAKKPKKTHTPENICW